MPFGILLRTLRRQNNKNIESMTDKEFEKLLDEVAGEQTDKVQKPDPRFTETLYGETINGGAYSVAYYYDKKCNPCRKAEAASVNIIEYGKNGERVNENYAQLL